MTSTTTDFKVQSLGWLIGLSGVVMFFCSSLRHLLFYSTAFDVGFVDQVVYLVSQGQTPVVSFWGHHFLGDHAAWIFYCLVPFYKIYPSIYWLFLLQALSLSLGMIPVWLLSRQAGLSVGQCRAMAIAYLLYPLIFNLNLFDFHTEVIALPLLLLAVFLARCDQIGWFVVCLLFVLGCRESLALTVVAMGVWLLIFEQKRWCGAIALSAGIAWFLVATQVIIPHFRPEGVQAVERYRDLGNSLPEIAVNVLRKPQISLPRLLNWPNLQYLLQLFLPFAWGLVPPYLTPLIGSLPQLLLNLLSDRMAQKDVVHQYSLPILPFLILAVIASLAANKAWIRSQKVIILVSLVGLLCLGKLGDLGYYLNYAYLSSLNSPQATTWKETRAAMALIPPDSRVLTQAQFIPHLTHRPVVLAATTEMDFNRLAEIDAILLSVARAEGFNLTPDFTIQLINQLQQDRRFQLSYGNRGVFLFQKNRTLPP